MTDSFFAARTAFPPSFAGQPVTYMWAVFGLLLLELLALEWIWRLWQSRSPARPWRHPLTMYRSILALLLMSPVLGGFPDLLLLMLWPGDRRARARAAGDGRSAAGALARGAGIGAAAGA